jgi:hypothetical protein
MASVTWHDPTNGDLVKTIFGVGCQIFRRIRRIEKHIPISAVEWMSQPKTEGLYICEGGMIGWWAKKKTFTPPSRMRQIRRDRGWIYFETVTIDKIVDLHMLTMIE